MKQQGSYICTLLLAITALFSLAAHASDIQRESSYLVIVNPMNDFDASIVEQKRVIKRLFLKEIKTWPDGSGIRTTPLARLPDSEEHQVFLQSVLAMEQQEFDAYWQELQRDIGQTPPARMESDIAVINVVGKVPGAFGIINAKSHSLLGNKARILFDF